jgi:membrane protein DedA with SNARE-associated domain
MVRNLLLQLLPYDYFLVFLTMMLEGFGMPVPGEVVLITSSIIAAQGLLIFPEILIWAALGAIIGNSIGYAIGFFGGKKLLDKSKLFKKYYDKIAVYYRKWGSLLIIFGRFFQGLRQLSGIFAGLSHMAFKQFLVYNIIGAVLWVCVWGSIAYFFGRESRALFHAYKRYELILLAFLLVSATALLIREILNRKKKRRVSS